jgi:hypothetical protein
LELHVATQRQHQSLQMMPITQAFSPFARSGGPTPVH